MQTRSEPGQELERAAAQYERAMNERMHAILRARHAGYSYREIAELCKVSHMSVMRLIREHKKENEPR